MATQQELLRSDRLVASRMIEMEFPAETLRVWSGSGPITTLDGKVWQGVSVFGQISIIRDTDDLAANEVIVGLRRTAEGVQGDPAAFSAAVNADRNLDVYNRAVRIYLQVFNPDTLDLVGNPQPEFIGVMSHIVTRREGTVAAEINLHCENLFAEGRKPPHIHYSQADQEARFPGDLGFEFIAANADRILTWPRD
jgi:hypothetical protein